MSSSLNVLGKQLAYFGGTPIRSGFFRDGYCRTTSQDHGSHSVAGIVSTQFLDYSGYFFDDSSSKSLCYVLFLFV